jgi:hypothetical protein
MKIVFTHLWVNGKWENTVYLSSDFKEVDLLGENDIDGFVFIAFDNNNNRYFLKGKYK